MEFDVNKLNDAQRRAMEDTEGAVLVLAGAGSGKTRVLTHRVAYLVLEKNIMPYNILAITFTNKATGEMKERLNGLLGEQNKVWISTFHSFCYYILRENAERIGYAPNFSIYDESDSLSIIKKVLREKRLDGTALKDNIQYHIGKAKNSGLTPGQYYAEIRGYEKYDKEIFEIYERYEELLKLSNAMDFDDLLHKTKELFSEHKDVLEKYQNRFHYIHVDEFQDTNAVQFEIVKLLAEKRGNLFVVGDDDQSIYGWRGADVSNILDFQKHYPEAKVHKLLENYRSTSAILDAANNVIKNNKSRHKKELFTNRGGGVKVEYFTAYNDYEEADWVIDTIKSLKRFYGYQNSDFAILIRANSLSRLFESKLSAVQMKYQLMGGFRFFERKEIQDVLAYMRAVNNMRDSEAIERIINFPRRGIGDTTVEKLSSFSRANMIDLIEVILDINTNNVLSGSAVRKVEEFRSVLADLYNNKGQRLDLFAEHLIKRVGFEAAYKETGKEEDLTRWENIEEFLRFIKEQVGENPELTLSGFLETAALAPERREIRDTDAIALATMHSVKGLEFKVVFITACEEDIFPSSLSKRDGGIEEERRLMYVAITRAKERLYITNARNRYRYNQNQSFYPSRFIAESKGDKYVSAYEEYEKKRAYIEGRERYNSEREIITPPKSSGLAALPRKEDAPKVYNKDLSGFVQGARVSHQVYGEGQIILVTGSGSSASATVLFPKLGIKKFLIALAPLTLISK